MTGGTPLKALIVDDEPLAVERLQILCAGLADVAVVGTATDGAAALRLIEVLAPDVILLDIQMPDVDGIAVARALEGRPSKPALIFVTAFDQFAVAAFDVAATDYLLKPVSRDRLDRAFARLRTVKTSTPSRATSSEDAAWAHEFWVPHRDEIVRLAARDIDMIGAERDYMRLHVGSRSYLLHATIADLERRLDPAHFVRIHRSTIVRRGHIVGFRHDDSGAWEAQVKGGQWLRVGRTYLANARAMAGRT